MTRSRLAAAVVLACALAGPSPTRAADPPPPPGPDAFSETALRGVRLAVGPRGAAADADGRVHCVYGDTVLRHAWHDGLAWRVETLSPFPPVGPPAGVEAAIAFGPEEELHAVWFDPRRRTLCHGVSEGGSFHATVVTGDVRARWPRAAVAIDSAGDARIAWSDADGTEIRYAAEIHGSYGAFATSVVANDAWGVFEHARSDVSLVVDAADRVHLGYTAKRSAQPLFQPRAFVHAVLDAGAWTFEDVDLSPQTVHTGVGAAGALAIDRDGTLHALYTAAPDDGPVTAVVRHAWRTAQGWQREDVVGGLPNRAHLTTDGAGDLHAVVSSTEGSIYLHRTAGAWTASPLGKPGAGVAMAVGGGPPAVFTSDAGRVRAGFVQLPGAVTDIEIDRASEALLAPSVAVGADLAPRIAIVRDDESGPHVAVLRRDGAAWSVRTIDFQVDVRVRPAIRVAPDDTTHVAWVAQDGAVLCASDAGGKWTPAVAAPAGSGANAIALAIDADGRRRVLFRDAVAHEIRVAVEAGPGAWSVAEVAPSVAYVPSPVDLAIGPDGVAHAVWRDGSGLLRTATSPSGGSGAWTAETVPDVLDFAAPASPCRVALDRSGDPWFAYVARDLTDGAHEVRIAHRTGDTWESEPFGTELPEALAFDADDVARAVTPEGGVTRAVRDAGGAWRTASLDAGPGTQRVLTSPVSAVAEGEVTVQCVVTTANAEPWFANRVGELGAAIDADGGFHAAYLDARTGDVRYVTNRDPGRSALPGVRVVPGDGTAHAPGDFEIGTVNLDWADDDSGTRVVPVQIHADDRWEPDETVVLRLESAWPTVEVGSPGEASFTIVEPVHDAPASGATFLPERIHRDPSGRVVIRAALQTGTDVFDPHRPPRIRFGAQTIDVPYLARHRGAWRYETPDVSLALRRVGASPSRWRCDLEFVPDPDEADPVGRLDVRFDSHDVAAGSVVYAGREFAVGTGPGEFDDPWFHLVALRGSRSGLGSLALTAVPASLSGADYAPFPQHVTVAVDGKVLADAFPSAFRRHGARYVARTGHSRLEIDYAKGTVRARITGTHLPAAARDGVVPLALTLRLGNRTETIRTRVVLRDGRLRW